MSVGAKVDGSNSGKQTSVTSKIPKFEGIIAGGCGTIANDFARLAL
jgi:hypothetical protein